MPPGTGPPKDLLVRLLAVVLLGLLPGFLLSLFLRPLAIVELLFPGQMGLAILHPRLGLDPLEVVVEPVTHPVVVSHSAAVRAFLKKMTFAATRMPSSAAVVRVGKYAVQVKWESAFAALLIRIIAVPPRPGPTRNVAKMMRYAV